MTRCVGSVDWPIETSQTSIGWARRRPATCSDRVRVEREAQAVADDRLVQRRVALVERHRGELDVEVTDRQLLPVRPADLDGFAGDRRLCTHYGEPRFDGAAGTRERVPARGDRWRR